LEICFRRGSGKTPYQRPSTPSGGESLPVTILFTDIRNFTTTSEKLKAQDVVKILNNFFGRICEPILREAAPWINSSAIQSWPFMGHRYITRTMPGVPSVPPGYERGGRGGSLLDASTLCWSGFA